MTRGVVAAAALAVLLWFVRRCTTERRRRLHRESLIDSLPDVVDLLIVLVRAGLTPLQALDEITHCCPAPWRDGFRAMSTARRQRGRRAVDALHELHRLCGPTARGLVDALVSCERFGQPLVPSLERLSLEARLARQRLHDVRARTLPVRLSFPLVLCILPAFGLVTIVPLIAGTLSSIQSPGGTP